MNLAHCIHGLGLGGAQKVIASIVRGRRADDLRYTVYSCNDGVHRREIEEAGATVRVIPRHLPRFDPLWVARLARAMRRDRIDLVHCHLFGDSLHGYLAARLAGGLPVLMTLHIGPEGLRGLQPRGYRWLLPRAAGVVSCSDAVGRAFTGAGLAPGVDVVSIPNGLEVAAREPASAGRLEALRRDLGAAGDTVLFAVIGRLEPQKGHRDLIAAFARLTSDPTARRKARLVVLGTGPLASELEEQARTLGVSRHIVFAGFRSDVQELLPALDVVVFSSLFEGLPVALLEAMAAGRCIVTTDVPGIVEAVRDGREALVAPIGEPERLAEAMARATGDPDLRTRSGDAARQRFHDRYTAAAMVRAYERLYRDAVTAPVISAGS